MEDFLSLVKGRLLDLDEADGGDDRGRFEDRDPSWLGSRWTLLARVLPSLNAEGAMVTGKRVWVVVD